MPRLAQPAGSEDAQDPIGLLGNLVKAAILRYLRSNPDVTVGPICDALDLGPTTVQPRLNELEAAGLVIADPPIDAGAVKLTVACPFPPVAVPMVGAPGTIALTLKLCDTCGAAE